MVILIPLVVPLFLFLSIVPVYSAVFNIPSGNVTVLIAAINAANSNGEENTIILENGIYTLTAIDNVSGGANGLPSITSKLTIRGAGAQKRGWCPDHDHRINPNSNALIPVAILSTNGFDASTVDQATVRFGPNQAVADGRGHLRGVNHDRLSDLVLQLRVQDARIECGDTSLSITGQSLDGISIQGADFISTVGCKGKKK